MGYEFIPASQIEPGDRLIVPGAELHEDLAGLEISVSAERVKQAEDGYIDVYQPNRDDRIWWQPDEVVKIYRTEK